MSDIDMGPSDTDQICNPFDPEFEPDLDPSNILDPGQMRTDFDPGQMRSKTINVEDFDKKYRVRKKNFFFQSLS